jgi:hypothetical protein
VLCTVREVTRSAESSSLRRLVLLAVGLLTAWGAAGWARDARLLLSNDGVHGSRAVKPQTEHPMRWPFMDFLGAPVLVYVVLVGLFACGAVCVLRGERKWVRLALLTSWVLTVAVNSRASFAVTGAETLLAVVLFWVLFLEVSEWDAMVVRAAQFQMAFVFGVPLVLRVWFGSGVWVRGEALAVIGENESAARGVLAGVARAMPDGALTALTLGVLAVEALIALCFLACALVPGRFPDSWRRWVWAAGVLTQVGVGLLCGLWFFAFGAIVALALLRAPMAVPAVTQKKGRRVSKEMSPVGVLAYVVMACVAVWNIGYVSTQPTAAAAIADNPAASVVRGLGLQQVWSVFSPDPASSNRWVEVRGADGSVLWSSSEESSRARKTAQVAMTESRGVMADALARAVCEDSGTREASLHVVVEAGAGRTEFERARVSC